ncbi:HAMP domain-containing sensor histidine kinase [Alteromonas oceanisediminis]|uniref:HAMP domain-containing sensor histidine kinase n=1 Tax=Alteromonas oceanisediminis TaxID=2836180 RepID=UPI001BDAC7D9|nr:HAMP domain-containing sensor histidine kinase [Alteromonas oceanisediminis]MBT0587552.1 HAMP domain-containing histidine kinase [Alteromonas oceanisediminis]
MQLGSLRQLTLVSFFVALIPLVTLLWQSQSDLARVAKMTAEDNAFFVSIVSGSRSLESGAIDLERLIRQYFIVKNENLAVMIDETLESYLNDVSSLCTTLAAQPPCGRLARRVERLSNYADINDELLLDAQLAEFRSYVNQLRASVSATVTDRISVQQNTVLSLKQDQAWSTAMLAIVSLLLIIFASQLIVKPFKKLKRVIHTIAKQQSSLPPISRHGPMELIGIEKDLHWLADRLVQLEHLRTALLRHASHELKTPLASIKEGCSLLNEQLVGELSPAQKEVVGLLISSTERLNTLVESLLDYNLLLQQAEPDFVDVSAKLIVDECLHENALALSQNDHSVEVDIQVDVIHVDTELFRRILDNLLSNAIAHGAKSRPISIKIHDSNSEYVIDVANRGKKIAQPDQAALFEPFNRGTERRNDSVVGAGLGLSIVSDCARLMQGSVKIVDVIYADVCFRVTIPKPSARGI